ncbi:MAG: helix-turn-helix domain-containing protein [Opitutaceae bacterium]
MPNRAAKISKLFGDAIREERISLGLSQEKLAERAGLSRNFYGCVERGEKVASIETVVRLARALGVNAEKLMRKARL